MESQIKKSDTNLSGKVDEILKEVKDISMEEMHVCASIADEQLKSGAYKTTEEAKKKLEKWIK